MAPRGGRHPATEAIEGQLAKAGRSQTWLAAEVARIEGRNNPYSQAAVSAWLSNITEQPPARIFAIEEALGVKPGAISRHLGFLPASARSARTVLDAIDADPALTDSQRHVLKVAYEASRSV